MPESKKEVTRLPGLIDPEKFKFNPSKKERTLLGVPQAETEPQEKLWGRFVGPQTPWEKQLWKVAEENGVTIERNPRLEAYNFDGPKQGISAVVKTMNLRKLRLIERTPEEKEARKARRLERKKEKAMEQLAALRAASGVDIPKTPPVEAIKWE